MSEMFVNAGERKRVLWLLSSSMPGPVRFDALAEDGQQVSGKIEIGGGFSGRVRETHALAPENEFRKGFGDANYSIWVTPDQDVRIRFRTAHFRAGKLVLVMGLVLLAALASSLVPALTR